MRILALDTASSFCSAAVWAFGELGSDPVSGQHSIARPMPKGHAEALFSVIDELFVQSSCTYEDIDKIVTSTGPGSFTGLRVGISAARAIAMALHIPIVGVSTLEALAYDYLINFADQNSLGQAHIWSVFDARRGEVYAQKFDSEGKAVTEPAVYVNEDLAKILNCNDHILGSGAHLVALNSITDQTNKEKDHQSNEVECDHHVMSNLYPDISAFARIGANRDMMHNPPKPLYLRKPDAKPQNHFALARQSVENAEKA